MRVISLSSSLVDTSGAIKICDSILMFKVANKCLNVHEQVEVAERNKRGSPPLLYPAVM